MPSTQRVVLRVGGFAKRDPGSWRRQRLAWSRTCGSAEGVTLIKHLSTVSFLPVGINTLTVAHSSRPPQRYNRGHRPHRGNPRSYNDSMRRSPDLLSKEELGESSTGGSPFVPEVLDKSIPHNFRLLTLEAYDGSSDLTEYIMAFRAQMALYET
ncbi:hypothetical protein BHE74_00008130 [Ensete ventricosum]|nr:hypothetical protein BHE74_00008130 [Ensete ventricosum]